MVMRKEFYLYLILDSAKEGVHCVCDVSDTVPTDFIGMFFIDPHDSSVREF